MNVFAFLDVEDPWIAWLVYRAEMVALTTVSEQALSLWHTKYLRDAVGQGGRVPYYRTELEIDRVRSGSFPQKVSRLSGLYFFEDVASARRAGRRWDGNFREDHLAEIELIGQYGLSRYDSEWISQQMGSGDWSWITDYLSGHPQGTEPLWELLVEGRDYVLGTDLRERAYEVVSREWPESLPLLEFARLAVELGSDLGLIVPMLTVDGNVARVRAAMDMRDARNPEFLSRLESYVKNGEGPVNFADLRRGFGGGEMRAPDLGDRFFEFTM